MPTAIENIPRTQITTLENGLKSLRHSKLMNSKELKDMYDAIEKHHREIRLAHLAGTPKDLLEQAKRDTKFFFILVKLLNETLIGTQHEQKDSLREVYSWYVGNKHTLASGPRFGKRKDKGKRKALVSPGRPISAVNKLGHVSEVASKALQKDYDDDLRALTGLPLHQACDADPLTQLPVMPKAGSPDASLHRPSSMTMSACRTEIESPDSSATKRLSEAHQYLLPKRQNKPLAHLYNPHAREYSRAEGQDNADSSATSVRFTVHTYELKDTSRSNFSGDERSVHLRKWEDFQEQIAYGQHNLNQLQHCGRLGVAGGQRYVAHDNGLAAEEFTPNVIATVAQDINRHQTPEADEPSQPTIPLEKQSLEDFYHKTQGHYPARLPKYPSFRLRSAPSTARQIAPASGHVAAITPSGRLKSSSLVRESATKDASEDEAVREHDVAGTPLTMHIGELGSCRSESPEQAVKLDTVVTMIDSVTDEMTFFKEKLTAEPMAGFRQPIVDVDPTERPQTAPSLGSLARPCTPLEEHDGGGRAMSAMSGGERRAESAGAGESDSARGSQHDARSLRSFSTEEWNTWKERFLHDSLRYKWQATPAGGRAYYRKAVPRPGSRSAGQGPSGARPRTAPQTPRLLWNTDTRQEKKKPAVAASHTTTEVEQDVTDSMLAVRRLGGKNAKQRRYRFFMDFIPDSKEPSRSAMTTPAMEYVSFIAPKPVAGSRASSAVPRSLMGSAMEGASSPLPADADPLGEDKADEELDSLDADFDLPPMDDLDDDLDDNFQYEGDAPLQEAGGGAAVESGAEPAVEDADAIADSESTDAASSEVPPSDDKQQSEHDFDSICVRSSTQESELDVEEQCKESRHLINEIATLVSKTEERVARPVSSHSRVTFQDERVECEPVSGAREPLNEQGRKVLKPKSILVPRHIQPPPSVGLTIVQFQGGGGEGVATQRAAHTPSSAPLRSRGRQVLSKSEHWSCDPAELEQIDYDMYASSSSHHIGHVDMIRSPTALSSLNARKLSWTDLDPGSVKIPRPLNPKPRMFSRAFPKPHPVPAAELDESLSVQGQSGGRSKSAKPSNRSAGVSPLRSRSASHFKMIQKQDAMLKKAPATPHRSAPSIPSVQEAHGKLPSHGPFSAEHESHAKREHSPRRYMERVGALRKSATWVPGEARRGRDGYLTTTLRVVSMQPSSRDTQSPAQCAGHPGTPVSYFEADPDRISERSEEREEGEKTYPARVPLTPGTERGTRIYIYSGRPIPDYADVPTPEQSQAADAQLKQAKAAVDIQRYFRGYVTRKNYKYLLREERHRREDERLAAVRIQNAYRAHLARTRRIYNRPLDPESLQWAREYNRIQEEKAQQRNAKAGAVSMQHSINKAKAKSTLAVIGPHVEVYVPFHPKKTGAKKEVLNAAATCIQRHLKGWLLRKKFADIKRKAKQHANSWGRFIQQYRDLVRRVQMRHGITRPKVPFHFQQVSEFMDLKKMYESKFIKVATSGYESGFESHAFAGELEIDELPEYFRECDLYPVQGDIDEAFDLVFRGQIIKKGLQRHQVMELTFQLYPPAATGISNSRKSTWTNPVVNGEEGNKILVRASLGRSTEYIEPTDFGTAWNLVAGTVKARREREETAANQRQDAEVKAKLEALRLKNKPDSTSLDALKEEEERSVGSASKQSGVSTPSRDRRVKFTESVEEKNISPRSDDA